MKNAFTLIELLVVVLIIGILSAIALPQYTRAVNKARFSNLRTMAVSLSKASQTYYLENGRYPTTFDEIPLDLPGGFSVSKVGNNTCAISEKFYCCLIASQEGAWSAAFSCGQNDYSFIAHHMIPNHTTYCVADGTNTQAIKLCQSFGSTNSLWEAVPTPDGIKTNHPYYEVK